MSTLRQENPEAHIIVSDIYNIRKEDKKRALGGHTPAQALVKELEISEYQHQLKTDTSGHITHLFFAHPQAVLQLKAYPDVLLMDCTYKTNRFKMPLMVIVGSTNLNTTFHVAYCFLANEGEEDYLWAVQALKVILDQPGHIYPGVVVTDREVALINAVRLTFPMTKRLLCLWHINENVLSRVSKNFEEGPLRDKFMEDWAGVLASPSRLDFEKRWDSLFDDYSKDYEELVWYLKDTWLVFKWNIVRFWVDQNLHFGNRVTSRVESAHSTLKRYLQVSTGDLGNVLEKIHLLLQNQHQEHHAALESARQRIPHDVNIPLFLELIGKITPFALRKILGQHQRLSTLPLVQCTNEFTQSMGLPCAHILLDRQYQNDKIHLHDIHPHWYFVRPDPSTPSTQVQPGSLIQEPLVAKPKGRPVGSKNKNQPLSSTRREPSSFELPTRRRQGLRPRAQVLEAVDDIDETDS
jgi:hypothetical protein